MKVSEREPFEPIKTFPKPNLIYYVLRIHDVWMEERKKEIQTDFISNDSQVRRVKKKERKNERITQRTKRAVSEAIVKKNRSSNFWIHDNNHDNSKWMNRKKLQRICEKEMLVLGFQSAENTIK